MALQLNLLHEEILEQTASASAIRSRSALWSWPGSRALLFLYYMWNAYRTLEIKARLSARQHDWAKVEPKVTAAQKRSPN